MAKNTKIIKLTNGTYTYVPVTLADAVQYSYEGGAMSVQQAIGTLATSQISIAEHLHPQGTDLQTHSTSVTSNVGYIILSQNEDKVYIKNGGSSTATSTYAHVGITTEGTKGLILKVSYTDTKPASANFSVSDGSTSKTAFGSNESTAKTLTIKGATGTPIETAVSQSGNTTTVDIKHKTSGVTAGTYGTNSTTTISAGSTGSIVVPQVEVNSYGHVTSAANQSISIDLSGLTGAMHWVGVSSTDPKGSSGATVSNHTWANGDVVTYNSKEYVLSGNSNAAANWLELGDEGSHALKGTTTCSPGDGLTGTTMYAYVTGSNGTIQHAVPTNASAGKKDSADNNFIKSVTTDKFGHVTAYTTGTFTQDHTKSGTITVGQLTYWNGTTTHTAVTASYGSSTKSIYIDGGVIKEGSSFLTSQSKDFGKVTTANNETTYTAPATSAVSAVADTVKDELKLTGANAWIRLGTTTTAAEGTADADNITIGHVLSPAGAKTSGLYKITTDAAGHITAATAVSADKVIGSVTSNYKIVEGKAIDNLDADFLSRLELSGNTGSDIATGNQTTNNYYHS